MGTHFTTLLAAGHALPLITAQGGSFPGSASSALRRSARQLPWTTTIRSSWQTMWPKHRVSDDPSAGHTSPMFSWVHMGAHASRWTAALCPLQVAGIPGRVCSEKQQPMAPSEGSGLQHDARRPTAGMTSQSNASHLQQIRLAPRRRRYVHALHAEAHATRRCARPACLHLERPMPGDLRRQGRGSLQAACSTCCGATAAPLDAAGDASNALQRALRWLLARTGLLQAARALEDNRAASIAALLFFVAALLSSLAAGVSSPVPLIAHVWHMPACGCDRQLGSVVHDAVRAGPRASPMRPHAQSGSCWRRRCWRARAASQQRPCTCWRACRSWWSWRLIWQEGSSTRTCS
jgi:hypothetical protein